MRRRALALVVSAVVAASCAKRVAPPIPEGEDYVAPVPAAGEVSAREARELREAWSAVLSGEAAGAARRYERLLARRPDLAAARAGLAYARLRGGRLAEARSGFDDVLRTHPRDRAALVGAASAALRAGDLDTALGFSRRALAEDPSDAVVRRRLAGLKLQVTERHMALAEAAAGRGEAAVAESEYAAALGAAPEVAPVRLALADLLVSRGDAAGAVALLEADPSADRGLALRRAALLLSLEELDRAEEVYRGLLARDPEDEAARAGEAAVSEARVLSLMPAEYRAIPEADRLSRADLAALLAVRVRALRKAGPGEPRVAVDIGGEWAREHVARVLALGVMDVYPNHTFHPRALVRRLDVARAVARVLDLAGWPRAAAPPVADVPGTHLDHAAVARVLGAGLMELDSSGAFEPWRAVSGPEAVAVVDALDRLLGS